MKIAKIEKNHGFYQKLRFFKNFEKKPQLGSIGLEISVRSSRLLTNPVGLSEPDFSYRVCFFRNGQPHFGEIMKIVENHGFHHFHDFGKMWVPFAKNADPI